MAVLSVAESADFMYLIRETGLTRVNFSVRLTRLQEAGYIKISKEVRGQVSAHNCFHNGSGQEGVRQVSCLLGQHSPGNIRLISGCYAKRDGRPEKKGVANVATPKQEKRNRYPDTVSTGTIWQPSTFQIRILLVTPPEALKSTPPETPS